MKQSILTADVCLCIWAVEVSTNENPNVIELISDRVVHSAPPAATAIPEPIFRISRHVDVDSSLCVPLCDCRECPGQTLFDIANFLRSPFTEAVSGFHSQISLLDHLIQNRGDI
jgi:hypothetical protein